MNHFHLLVTTVRIKNIVLRTEWYYCKTHSLNKKIDPVDSLSGFWTKFSKWVASTSCKPQLKIPYLFSWNCANTGSSPILKSLGRSSTVNNVYPRKLFYNASLFIKIILISNWPHSLTSFKVEWIWNSK